MRSTPWQPASTTAEVGSPSTAASAASRSGLGRLDLEQARVALLDLLAGVPDIGHVERRVPTTVRASSSMTARPPFMSAAPSPEHRSPSRTARSLPFGGTVSRCPARSSAMGAAERGAGDDVVADASRLEVIRRREALAVTNAAALASSWLTEGMSTSSAVSSSRPASRRAHAEAPCSRRMSFSMRLVVALAGRQMAHDQHARQEELAARVLLAAHGADGDAPGRHVAPPELLARPGVDHRDRRVEDRAFPEHRPLARRGPLG